MSSHPHPALRQTALALSVALAISHVALAADPEAANTLEPLSIKGAKVSDPNSALYEAPSRPLLDVSEPQSVISEHFIKENAAAGANYTDLMAIAPSVQSIDPNGPGGMETQNISIRGFSDGQFNVTFDGIPLGDTNDFTHHSTAFFMNQDIGSLTVDRGPGSASTVGYATFGGNVAIQSSDPRALTAVTPFATLGSWNSNLEGVRFDTGTLQNYGDARAYVSYKNFGTDGYINDSSQSRQNIFLKFEKPYGKDTLVTFVATHNQLNQNVSYGTSLDLIAANGLRAGLSNDPTQQNYQGYNRDIISTDIEYLGVQTRLGGWSVDNKLYTYAYNHEGLSGGAGSGNAYVIGANLANFGTAPSANGTSLNPAGTALFPNDVPGNHLVNQYRSIGDILRASTMFDKDKLEVGLWFDRQTNDKSLNEVDWSQNGAFNYYNPAFSNPNSPAKGYAAAQSYIDTTGSETITTLEPYAQYVWHASDALSVTPGLKFASFRRESNFTIMDGFNPVSPSSETYSRALPAISAKYRLQEEWSAYAQYAEGFLAPRLQLLRHFANPSTIKPESSQNYQLGTVWASNALSVAADVYRVMTRDAEVARTCGAVVCYAPVGGVTYTGVEFEGTLHVADGLSLYGNHSVMNYSISADAGFSVLNNAPHTSTAAGVVYEQRSVYASLIAKYVGANYSNSDVNGSPLYFGGYTVANLNLNYRPPQELFGKDARLGFQVNNLFNRGGVFTSISSDGAGNPLYYVLPERSYAVSVTFGI